jgi:hypothetical protein
VLILTSFNDYDIVNDPEYKVYSISDKQPSDLNLSEVKYDRMSVFIPNSNLLGLSKEVFSKRYFEELENKQEEIKKVIRELFFSSDDSCILLCCWCNENFKKEESLFCHRVIIKKFLDKHFPYIKVELRGIQNE